MATGQKKPRDPSERIARRLLAEGRITQELHDAAMRHRRAKWLRFEEAVIAAGVSEEQLLRLLAEMYRVQYISTAKLAAAAVDKRTLALVPVQIAEQRQVVPVLLDRQRSILSVVTSDPDDIETLKELEIATQVRTIKALVARPLAVAAAISKFYHGDDFAFSVLRNENFDVARAIERDPLAHLLPQPTGHAAPRTDPTLREFSEPQSGPYWEAPSAPFAPAAPAAPAAPVVPAAPVASASASAALPPMQAPPPIDPTAHLASTLGSRATGELYRPIGARPPQGGGAGSASALASARVPGEMNRIALTPPPPPIDEDSSPLPVALAPSMARSEPPPLNSVPPPARFASAPPPSEDKSDPHLKPPVPPKGDIIGDPFQLAVVMLSLLEGNRKDLRGHSIQTARLVRKVCEKFNVPASRSRSAEIAALFHDVGKASSYHLTPYNVARFDGHQAAAQKMFATPSRVVETARLAKAAVAAVTHMYERYDGKGFPDGLKASEIPLESRILAICDSYTDLTSNPRNSFRKVLPAQEACEALRELQGTVFDPKVVDRFSRAVLGDDIAQRLRGDRGLVLLVDEDIQETTVLELALLEKRYDVYVVRAMEEALQFFEGAEPDVVVSEMILGSSSGFDLLRKLRETGHEKTSFVFLSEVTDSGQVAEALEAGAADYLFKPIASQVVVAKIKRLLEQNQAARGGRGVSGSLEEMSVPDIVQILHQGRKTGALQLSSEGQEGTVFFKDGIVVGAGYRGLKGEEAFYAIVGISKGGFRIEPGVSPAEETVHASPEMLLLEGMRRLDEANR